MADWRRSIDEEVALDVITPLELDVTCDDETLGEEDGIEIVVELKLEAICDDETLGVELVVDVDSVEVGRKGQAPTGSS